LNTASTADEQGLALDFCVEKDIVGLPEYRAE